MSDVAISPKVIGTHNGKFHADEVLGCFLLKQLPEYKTASICRTRDLDKLALCDIVIDVGAEYDHAKKRYDHHQRSFNETLKSIRGIDEDIKLSSAGLVWAHYGKDVLKALLNTNLSEQVLHDVYCRMYEMFIKEVDARDNGIEIADAPFRYRIFTDFGSRVSRLNVHSSEGCEEEEEKQFKKAMEMAEVDFKSILDEIVLYWLPSREVVNEALDARFSVDPSGRIVKIPKAGISWPSHLKFLEIEKRIKCPILFVLFPDKNGGWRVQAVPKDGGFILRQQILPKFMGMRDCDLAAACGVDDAIFVHPTGFIAGARSYEGALQMALMSIFDESSRNDTDSLSD